jgi:drug/metabolite transporter (DMT)-like permease
MIDEVDDRAKFTGLTTRVIQGNFSIAVNYMAVKFFDLTTVAMVVNCAPLITCVLAAFFLDEKIKRSDVIYLFLAFSAVSIMVFGDPNNQNKKDRPSPNLIAIIALFFNPIAIATGNVAMRKMRKLHENVVSCWMSLSMIFVFVPLVLISG